MKKEIKSFEDYISRFLPDIQSRLRRIMRLIQENAPGAIESISYGMPAYKTNKKPLVYFAAFDKHIGFYATPTGHEHFKKELSFYKHGKGSVQFPHNKDLPMKLIAEIIKFRVSENDQST